MRNDQMSEAMGMHPHDPQSGRHGVHQSELSDAQADAMLAGRQPRGPPMAVEDSSQPGMDMFGDMEGMEGMQPPEQSLADVLFNVGFGILFRCISIAQRAPFDRVNYLLQVKNELVRQGKLPKADDFNGAQECVKVCYKKQGFRGFWRGLTVRCVSMLPLIMVNNLGNSMMAPFFLVANGVGLPEFPSIVFANLMSYTMVAAIAHPVEVVQLRMAAELCTVEDEDTVPREERAEGFFSFLRRVVQVEGPLALWRGLGTSLVTAAVGNISFFLIADRVQAVAPSLLSSEVGHGIGTFVVMSMANMVIYPLDTLRRRLMVTIGAREEHRYGSWADIFQTIRKEEGGLVRNLYAGCQFMLLRAFGSFVWGFVKMKVFPGTGGAEGMQ